MMSVKMLCERLGLDTKQAKQLREAMANANGFADDEHGTVDDAMDLANRFMDGCGVEAIRGDGQWDSYYGDCEALYVNMGDTYDATLVYDCRRGIFQATSYGDWIEIAERRGIHCP